MNNPIANSTIEIGNRIYPISHFIPEELCTNIRKKFSDETDSDFLVALQEVIKFLYLCAYAERSLFFPGNKLVDLIWHSLVTETAHYRFICSQIRHGCFIDHTGIKYQDYIAHKSPASVHEEQFSWLISYVNSFGQITVTAFKQLPLAQTMAARLKVDLEGLNHIAKEIGGIAHNKSDVDLLSLDMIIARRLRPHLLEADRCPQFAGQLIQEVFASIRQSTINKNENVVLNPSQLETIFGISPPLGFALWQHLAAIERLNNATEWQKNNNTIWQQIRKADQLVGLATTHLASPNQPMLNARRLTDGKFVLNGFIPWASGRSYFQHLIIGFRSEEEIVFALIDFPQKNFVAQAKNEIRINEHKLEVCNSTDSISINLTNFEIEPNKIVSRGVTTGKVQPRQSLYSNPEIGIAEEVLNRISNCSQNKQHPKFELVLNKKSILREKLIRLRAIDLLNNSEWTKQKLSLEIENTIYDAMKLLLIAEGADSLKLRSETLLLQSQLSLLHSWVQNSDLIRLKIETLGE